MEGNVTPTAITRSSREGPGYNQSSKINYEFALFLREIIIPGMEEVRLCRPLHPHPLLLHRA